MVWRLCSLQIRWQLRKLPNVMTMVNSDNDLAGSWKAKYKNIGEMATFSHMILTLALRDARSSSLKERKHHPRVNPLFGGNFARN
jgi:hypothetical protein